MNVLVLDLGSSSTRALCFDEHGDVIDGTLVRESFDFATGPDGRSEDDADAALGRAERVLTGALRAAPEPPAAVAVSAYAASLVCLDGSARPITPVYTYADTRCSDDAARLRAGHDEAAALQRTGCRVRANYHPAKLAWLRRTQPDAFDRARWFVSLSDYIRMRLSGSGAPDTSASLASWAGLLDRRSLDWDDEWLAALGLTRDRLPRVSADAAEIPTGAGRAAPLLPALGDGAAANIGAGCTDATRIAVTIGTTGAMRIATPAPPRDLPESLWCYRVDGRRALIGGATTEGGNVVAWLQRSLRLPDLADVDAGIGSLRPDGHGLTVLPMFAGERSPGFSDAATATVHGLTLSTTPAEIYQATLEAIAYRLAMICDHVRGVCAEAPELVASGGALAASPAWRQMVADAAGLPLRVCEEPEATARGAAVVALERFGHIADVGALPPRLGPPTQPNDDRHALYRAAMRRQQTLYHVLTPRR